MNDHRNEQPQQAADEWTLRLRAEPTAVPGVVRLRRFLKLALRSFRLRCVDLNEAHAPRGPPDHPHSPG